MRQLTQFFYLSQLLLFFMAACSSAQKSESNHKLITAEELRAATEHRRKLEVVLKKNPPEYFSVILESQPGTGYAWREVANTAPVQRAAKPTMVNKDNTPGGISETIFLYTATGKGSGVVEYEYRQEWEKQDPYARKLRVDVVIR